MDSLILVFFFYLDLLEEDLDLLEEDLERLEIIKNEVLMTENSQERRKARVRKYLRWVSHVHYNVKTKIRKTLTCYHIYDRFLNLQPVAVGILALKISSGLVN